MGESGLKMSESGLKRKEIDGNGLQMSGSRWGWMGVGESGSKWMGVGGSEWQ